MCSFRYYCTAMYRVRHKSVNTPSSQDGGRGTHVTHFVQLYPQPLYTASQVRKTCRSLDEGVLTDLCLTGVLTDLCLTGVLTDLCLTGVLTDLCLTLYYWYTGVAIHLNSRRTGTLYRPGLRSRYNNSVRVGRYEGRIPVKARFSTLFQTGRGAYPVSYKMGAGSFPGVKRPGRGVDHPHHLQPRLKKE